MTALETIFAWLIAILSALGLLLSFRVTSGKRRKQFFVYYTNLSNLAMLLVHGLLLIPGRCRALLRTPPARYLAAMCILVTFVIYFFVLTRFGRYAGRDTMRSLGVRRISNALVHYVVPLLCQLEWLTAADKSGLGIRDAALWLLVPLAYFAFLLLRAQTGVIIENAGSLWPYGFMDREALGVRKWARNILGTLALFFLLGLIGVGIAALGIL